jgi:hypothetical protein
MKEIVSSNAGITVQNEEEEKSIYSIKTLPKVFLILFLLFFNEAKILFYFLKLKKFKKIKK